MMGTRLTQQITLSGDQEDMYEAQMGEGFEQGIREGMEKLPKEMERSASGATDVSAGSRL